MSPDGSRVHVASGAAGSVSVIDPTLAEVVTTIPVGRRPWGIAVSRDDRFTYTANGVSNDVSVVDLITHSVVATIPAAERPWGVAVR